MSRAFVAFGMLGALAFGGATAVMLYGVEDKFFESRMAEEAAWLSTQYMRDQVWPQSRSPVMHVYTDLESVPSDLRDQLGQEPRRHEFRGTQGRHYHVRALGVDTTSARPRTWLVSEVSAQLVVRPLRGHLLTQWLIVGAVVLLAAVVLAMVVARRITKPLSSLVHALRTQNPAADNGESSLQLLPAVQSSADRELLVVAETLDMWSSRARAHITRERDFTRDASHELRTPLTVLQSTTTQVLRDPTLSPQSRSLLERAERSTAELRNTIDILLLLAREQRRSQKPTPVAIRALIEQIILDHAAALDDRGLHPVVDVPRHVEWNVDAAVLRLVLVSLTNNALTHAAPGPLAFALDDDVLCVENVIASRVADEAVHSPNDPSDVHGLGLPLVERLCAEAGLTVAVLDSDARFRVELRLALGISVRP